MATDTVTPNLTGSEGASAAPVSTPSPEVSTSTPSTSSTPSAPPTPQIQPGEDPRAFLRRVRDEREAAEAAKTGTKPAEVKPVEAKPAEVKTEDAKPTEAKPAEEVKPAEATEEIDPELSLDEQKGPIPPQELAQKWTPEIEEALKKAGFDKNQVFAMSRLAAKATKYDEIFTDFEQAKFAAQQADTFAQADDLFTNIKVAQSQGPEAFHGAIDNFMGLLLQLDQAVDGEGNPLTENGRPVLQGNAQAFVQGFRDLTLNTAFGEWKQMAEKSGDDEFQAALDILEQRVKGSAPEDVPESAKAERARLSAETQALNRQREADAEAKHQEFESSVVTSSREKYTGMIDKLVGQTDLTDGFKKVATDMIIKGLAEKLSSDPRYKQEREALARLPYSEQAKAKRIALNERYGKAILKQVAEPVFKELGAKILSRQQATETKVAAQVEASKAEPKGSTASAAPAAAVNVKEAVDKYISDYTAKNGRQPDALDVIKFRRSLSPSL